MAATTQERDAPKDIKFDCIIVDLAFHPEKEVIACGDIDGDVMVHSYSTRGDNHELMKLTHHKKACRCISFSPDGNKLFTGSKDKSLCVVDMERGALAQTIKKAHSCPLYSMYAADENIVVTGDDEGTLKVWDMRHQKAVMEVQENDDFISDMVLHNKKRLLLATSGDGTLSAYDIRKHKLKVQSELFDSEMLSLAIVKGGEKVVVGNGDGALNIFNWSEWGNISDRFPGHPMSIDCIQAFTDDIIFTGSFDGMVRAISILPNRFMGIIGKHEDLPVENMSLSHCRRFLASCSHDQCIRFWNVEDVAQETVDATKKAKRSTKDKILNKTLAKDDFFADMMAEENQKKEGEDDDEDDEDSDEDSEAGSEDEENSKCPEETSNLGVAADSNPAVDGGDVSSDDSADDGDVQVQVDSDDDDDTDITDDSDEGT